MPCLTRRLLLAASLAVLILPLVRTAPLVGDEPSAAPTRPLVVTFLDIGQGDSALIETPDGHAILIDGGEGKTPDAPALYPFDAGSRVVLPVLQKKGITTLDLVIATHPHSDHIGGLVDVLADRSIAVKQVWESGCTTWAYPSYEKLNGLMQERLIPHMVPEEGKSYDWGSGVSALVLHVDSGAEGVNDSSIVVRVAYGSTSFLFTGDAEKAAEAEMVEQHAKELQSTVLKVGHHGSKTSSNPPFVAAVKPKIAVISCGAYNGYGHPRSEPIGEIEKNGAKVYRTDRDSHVMVSSDGKAVSVGTAAAGGVDLPKAGFDAPEIAASALGDNVGKWVTLKGKVTDLRKPGDGGTYILKLDEKASVVIFKGVSKVIVADGVALDDIKGKEVTITGQVQDHEKYGLQIVVNSKGMFHVTP